MHRRVDVHLRKHAVAQAPATPPHTVDTLPRTPSRRARSHIRHQEILPPNPTHARPRPRPLNPKSNIPESVALNLNPF